VLDEWRRRLRRDLLRTQLTAFAVWGPAHAFNFSLLPPSTRVLFNSVGQVGWVAFLSFVGHKRNLGGGGGGGGGEGAAADGRVT